MEAAFSHIVIYSLCRAFPIINASLLQAFGDSLIMPPSRPGAEISAGRSFSDVSEIETVQIGIDLVSAARRNIRFLRTVAECEWLHQKPIFAEAIRRYERLWMPLVADLTVEGSPPPLVHPPLDVEWVWFCHSLNSVAYQHFCETNFSKLIGKPTIFDEENEEYALTRCREIWVKRYPSDPFENEADSDCSDEINVGNEEICEEISKMRFLYSKFLEPYRSEIVYLIAAKQRYRAFLYMLQRFSDENSSLVPASDILLMWITHQGYPTVYAEDVPKIKGEMRKVVRMVENVKEREVEETMKLWETAFDQPYEKAGGCFFTESNEIPLAEPKVYWDVFESDINTKYKSLKPRFLLEVCVFVGFNSSVKPSGRNIAKDYLRLRMIRCHQELKLDKPTSTFFQKSWNKAWHFYCEFGTKGFKIELRCRGGNCFKGSKTQHFLIVYWNDLLRAPALTLERQIDGILRIVSSLTPPVQAPYLLKCVPDKVTDDSGAMISDVILRMNHYRPQEGRWLSRTVLDHAGRACFVIRIRVGWGFWRRGGETPSLVKWENRITEIREGSWSYVAGSIGKAPEKVVGTATPKEPPEQWKAAWSFSTGDELTIQWDALTSIHGLSFCLKNEALYSSMKLLNGRKMQYQKWKPGSNGKKEEEDEIDEEEEGFVTLLRSSDEHPEGKATALFNWKLLIMEVTPEEDAVFVLLLCISILRSVSEMKSEDVGKLLMRGRVKQTKIGERDWGSVTLHSSSSPHLQPWYWNVRAMVASDGADQITRQQGFNNSAADGGDRLYERAIIR